MRLGLYHYLTSTDSNITWYNVEVDIRDDKGKRQHETKEQLEKLSRLMPRIEDMCKKVLGTNFHRIQDDTKSGRCLQICVTQGTSKHTDTKFAWRNLVGWIVLCDEE